MRRVVRIAGRVLLGLVVLLAVFAGVQYAVWAHDSGPQGCVAKVYRVVAKSTSVDRCLSRRLQRVLDRKGVEGGLNDLARQTRANPLFESRCHLPMHVIGQRMEAAGFTPHELERASRTVDFSNVCAKGFVHGYMQGLATAHAETAADLVRIAETVCRSMVQADRDVCVHGVGHGVARAARNDLHVAARSCAQMPRRDETNCIKGAVMELQFTDPHLKDRLKGDRNLGPRRAVHCGDVAPDQRRACRTRQAEGDALNLVFRVGGA